MKNGRPQAKDITDLALLGAVRDIAREEASKRLAGVMRWDLEKRIDFPSKVILSKCQALIDRKLLDGCTCGCRGDFELTRKGEELLTNIN